MKAGALLGLGGGVLARAPVSAAAQTASPWSQQQKLFSSAGAANDRFGDAVAISDDGTTAIVGAFWDDDNGNRSGSASVFTRVGDTWNEHAKLLPGDGAAGDHFGGAVAISGDGTTAIGGAFRDDEEGTDSGSAYVFARAGDEWTEQAKLLPGDGESHNRFGGAVTLSNDGTTAIVGASLDDDNGPNSGSAYVFTQSGGTWTEQAKLLPSNGEGYDRFGETVAISDTGTVVLVGSSDRNSSGSRSSVGYVFTRSGDVWSHQQTLLPEDWVPTRDVPTAVALSGDGTTAFVGISESDDNGFHSGCAHVFSCSDDVWNKQQILIASDGTDYDRFGDAVSLSSDGTTALIGASHDNGDLNASGSAYVFTQAGGVWSEQQKLTASDEGANHYFGDAVALSGDGTTALAGAPEVGFLSGSGSAYVFTRPAVEPNEPAENVLRIDGSGSYAAYEFDVSGTIEEGRGLSSEDSIAADRKSASGAVRAGQEEYVFTGDLLRFQLVGEATVLLNGEAPDAGVIEKPLTPLTIRGSGEYAEYAFSVNGDLEGRGLSSEDAIDGRSATGAVRHGQDSYSFTGEITDFTLNGSATVLVDGEPYTPATTRENTLTVRGTGTYSSYTLTVTSDDLAGVRLTSEDSIDGRTATGAVRAGSDSYHFSGEVESLVIDGEATPLLNGRVYSP